MSPHGCNLRNFRSEHVAKCGFCSAMAVSAVGKRIVRKSPVVSFP